MVRKRRRPKKLQERVNEMWPPEVRNALDRERRGEKISKERQLYLIGLIVAAIEEKHKATLEKVEGAWVEIRIVHGKLRAYRFYRSGDDIESEYIGDVGDW